MSIFGHQRLQENKKKESSEEENVIVYIWPPEKEKKREIIFMLGAQFRKEICASVCVCEYTKCNAVLIRDKATVQGLTRYIISRDKGNQLFVSDVSME